ncbi:C-type lectin domain family 4 member E-like [Trichomycterus rosablanca]|uniref:C-type lectin domain family 4 member E-like n=1 Tax=Trichomycterus rosablanca TaxID=2290929 RepID=UPI002F351839
METTENRVKGGYNEIEIQDDFSTDVHPLYSKVTRFTVRDGPVSRSYRMAAIVLGILSAAFLFILIGLGVHINKVTDKHDTLSLNSSKIFAQLAQLQSDHKSLTESKTALQKKHNEDTRLITSLRSDMNAQTRLKDNLQTQNRNLQEETGKLKTQLTNLEENCGKCLPNWVLNNSTCYYFAVSDTTPRKGWDGSRDDCKKKEADLVVIETEEEEIFIVETIKALRYNLPFSYRNGFWIGLKDDHTEGIWRWLNQSILTQGYWNDGEPNDEFSIEDCAAVYPFRNPLKAWNDAPCSHPLKWICEKPIDETSKIPQ